MFPGFMQAAILTVIVILAQTTKHIHCDDSDPLPDVEESKVLSLTNETFDDAVKNNKYLLVKFVAPWCGHCKSLTPAYDAAAKQLAESGSAIKLATVDATIEKDLAQKFEVKGYPTLKFFNDGVAIDYSGGRSKDEIIQWLKKKTGPPADELKTVDELIHYKNLMKLLLLVLLRILMVMLLLLFFKLLNPWMIFHLVLHQIKMYLKNLKLKKIQLFS